MEFRSMNSVRVQNSNAVRFMLIRRNDAVILKA
eukprot:COSAG02_NODE_1203_length_13900_cov_11.040287_3_plen_33_part_00